eukprot:COSAG01_NODE_4684_length_4814_cov_11.714952_4_plen_260_part_00
MCWQRELRERAESSAPPQTSQSAAQDAEDDPPKKGKQKWKSGKRGDQAPLSLGNLLTILDGGCPTPGRLIIMTTNQEDKLDRALVRPGRMKKVLMDNLKYDTFKQMVQHFRPNQRNIPIHALWTLAVDEIGQALMEDFQRLGAMRDGHLDMRELGLSPALLQELCLDAHTLQDVFAALAHHMRQQVEAVHEVRVEAALFSFAQSFPELPTRCSTCQRPDFGCASAPCVLRCALSTEHCLNPNTPRRTNNRIRTPSSRWH